MGRRRVHPPASSDHQTGSNSEQHKCQGLGFQEDHYTIVIGPKPWPPHYISCFNFSTSPFCRHLASYSAAVILILLLLLLHFTGSRPPETNLEALIVHDFNLTRNASLLVSPWFVNGNFTVVFQARNPSTVVGFRHRYVTTLVSAWYGAVLLGRSPPVHGFSQAQGSARIVSASLLIREQCVNLTTAAALRGEMRNGSVALRVAVDASVMVKRLWWPKRPRWFNFTCLVDANTNTNTPN